MDRLDREAMRERVNRLFMKTANADVEKFMEYKPVLDILWEEEFMDVTLRMVELAGKIPYRSARISFIQGIVQALLQPFSVFDAAGMLHMCLEDLTRQKPTLVQVLPFNNPIPTIDGRPRPGVA
ncbi:hypothetical protein LCGC14_1726920 [marine sediment metagenome]|uniref:Uncharacterized protein n=1 Tax=marine sediment metagenome TaxID=412755 RepID=A0A0F9JRB7_9ZZZZ